MNSKGQYYPIKKSKFFYLQILTIIVLSFVFFPGNKIQIFLYIFLLIPIILQIILHINYYLHDLKVTVKIDYINKKIEYLNGNDKAEIPFEKIKEIIRFKGSRYQSPVYYYFIPSYFYNYTLIKTVENKVYKFTDFTQDEFNVYGIKNQEVIVPFLNVIK
ncbi:hypothetical protein KIH23_13370 [Flavobacterium sp. CYK-55]|uniref:hypothetical protein n=1 Tax=Flavobacterium sp. CYK-55 TaxID=2835529 RepID=UPI001BCB4351|nr:hypothetical protein [Flavobacterium sp. CYK-55]MBS7788292.1 hypothetical protein [Flavobacterium sp. CYK-55]